MRQRRRERLDLQQGIRVGERYAVEKVIALWGATSKGARGKGQGCAPRMRLSKPFRSRIRPGVKVATLPARTASASGDRGGAFLEGPARRL